MPPNHGPASQKTGGSARVCAWLEGLRGRDGVPPLSRGLYDPATTSMTSCGVGLCGPISRAAKSHEVIACGLQILVNLDHRGGRGGRSAGRRTGGGLPDPDPRRPCCATGANGEGPDPAGRRRNTPWPCVSCRRTMSARTVGRGPSSNTFLTVEKQPLIGLARRADRHDRPRAKRWLAQMPVIRQAIIGRGPNVKDQGRPHERKACFAIRKQTPEPRSRELARKHNMPAVAQPLQSRRCRRGRWSTRGLPARPAGGQLSYKDLTNTRRRRVGPGARAPAVSRPTTFPSWRLGAPLPVPSPTNGEINHGPRQT